MNTALKHCDALRDWKPLTCLPLDAWQQGEASGAFFSF